ncbi:MAG: phosphoribosyltransferase [Thermoleophilia bacterium]|nr:phosphoribosyltransferase [Thermoleophilia bacterium]
MLTEFPTEPVQVPIEGGHLEGDLVVPGATNGLVVFAHGSGSSRHSPRNRAVARILNSHGLATLLCDLLTEPEGRADAASAQLRFDIDLLADRVGEIIAWTRQERRLRSLRLGVFGASTGAAAALVAATRDAESVGVVVSRGGRPDLAGAFALALVQAPTLLIVGSRDTQVLKLNQRAAESMRCTHEIAVIPGAGHLFEERGTLDQAAELAASWFTKHLGPPAPLRPRRFVRQSKTVHRSGPYVDREEAGNVLARAVESIAVSLSEPIVVALPRGGVPVAVPVARSLDAPLDIAVVRKVGVPHHEELALGAVDEDGRVLVDQQLVRSLGVGTGEVQQQVQTARSQLRRRSVALRGDRPMLPLAGHDVLLVDDGYATGMTARCAARFLARHGAPRIILAVPVGPTDLLHDPPEEFDTIICPFTPSPFRAVGIHYHHFTQVSDAQVRDMLAERPA